MAHPKGKTCTKCRRYKLFAEFHIQKDGRFGRHGQCKACRNRYHRGHFQNLTPEQRAAHNERSKIAMRRYKAHLKENENAA
jgi:hypothetical protein